jgi:hypothetical protein
MASSGFYPADYIVKSGRAVVLPVFKGSFERWDPALGLAGEEYFRATRQRLLQWRQDLGRTIDYLGTRSDIDMKHIGYYGRSFGASMPLPLLALEPRLRVAVLHSAGFTYRRLPAEMDAVNYVSRIRMPVLMMTGVAGFAHCASTCSRTCDGSSRTMAWPETRCPPASSSSRIARPLVSVSAVRVSLTVRTKQATEAGPWMRCSL